jgi:hypothetical protein
VRHVARRDRARSENYFLQKSKIAKSQNRKIAKSQKGKSQKRKILEIFETEKRLAKSKTPESLQNRLEPGELGFEPHYRKAAFPRHSELFPINPPIAASSLF